MNDKIVVSELKKIAKSISASGEYFFTVINVHSQSDFDKIEDMMDSYDDVTFKRNGNDATVSGYDDDILSDIVGRLAKGGFDVSKVNRKPSYSGGNVEQVLVIDLQKIIDNASNVVENKILEIDGFTVVNTKYIGKGVDSDATVVIEVVSKNTDAMEQLKDFMVAKGYDVKLK